MIAPATCLDCKTCSDYLGTAHGDYCRWLDATPAQPAVWVTLGRWEWSAATPRHWCWSRERGTG